MEREQIIKALECFHQRILNTNLAKKITATEIIAIIDAIALIKELTEENEKLLTALANYDRLTDVRIAEEYYTAEAYDELREENEKLMSTSSLQGAIIGSLQVAANELTTDKERLEKLLDDKCDRCIERERANTVREFAERLKERAIPVTGGRGFEGVNKMATNLLIDQIAKEMLEGE